jgi:hypothetical protein
MEVAASLTDEDGAPGTARELPDRNEPDDRECVYSLWPGRLQSVGDSRGARPRWADGSMRADSAIPEPLTNLGTLITRIF